MKLLPKAKEKLFKSLIWLDRVSNKYLLFGRWETISSRAGRDIESDHPHFWALWLCNLLDVLDMDHCAKSAARNRIRRAELEQRRKEKREAVELTKEK